MDTPKIKRKYTQYDNSNPAWETIFEEINVRRDENDTKFIVNATLKYPNLNPDILRKKYNKWMKEKQLMNNNNINNIKLEDISTNCILNTSSDTLINDTRNELN
jgi:hypothetical protein